jgi:hypothetical protein
MIPGTKVRLSDAGRDANPDIADLAGVTGDRSNDGRTVSVLFTGHGEYSWLRSEYVETDGPPEMGLFE